MLIHCGAEFLQKELKVCSGKGAQALQVSQEGLQVALRAWGQGGHRAQLGPHGLGRFSSLRDAGKGAAVQGEHVPGDARGREGPH